jgi:Uma2 family endonuclease
MVEEVEDAMRTVRLEDPWERIKPYLKKTSPLQGEWSEDEYLRLTDHITKVEFTDGFLEFLPMPTDRHQSILEFLFLSLLAALKPRGKVHTSGLRLRIRPGKFREPDITALLDAKDPRRQNRFWTGADLVMEVVSEDKSKRDLLDKRADYAEGKVPEYWIVNPFDETITVLVLKGNVYRKHGVFTRGQSAMSVVVEGFSVDVNAVLDAD